MKHARHMAKAEICKRLLVSWVILAVCSLFLGAGITAAYFKHLEHLGKEPQPEKALIYGRYDGIIFEGEIPEVKCSSEFVPLDVPISGDLQEFIFYLSEGYEIDFTFVMALIQQESSFRADVISDSNDYGLMQVNEKNHAVITETLGVTDFLEPYGNVRSGMFILRKLFEKYETPEKVLMAYNLGETGAARLWEKGIYEINYSKSVFQYQQEFCEEVKRRKER